MNLIKKLLFAGVLAIFPFLHSCDDFDGYSIGDFTSPSWATIISLEDCFYLNDDSWGTLWPVNQNVYTDYNGHQPKDGQRVIISFNPLSDNYQGYDHAIKILQMQEVLTKGIDTLTADNEIELGNNPINIYMDDLCISGNHLNIMYLQNAPSDTKHRISLVRPVSDDRLYGEDGYINLRLCYNTYEDESGLLIKNAVSFNLASLKVSSKTKGIRLSLNTTSNGEIEVELPFNLLP